MSDKRYTAQNMREMANEHKFKCTFVTETLNGGIILNRTSDVRTMLLQAASAEEELAKVKARLDAVVKECEAIKSHYEKVVLSQLPITLVVEANRILRAARGEGGAE